MAGFETGSAAVELAVLAPMVLLVLLTVVQAGLWWHTRTVCSAAAQHGVQVARTLHGTTADAQSAAASFLAEGSGLVTQPLVSAQVTGTRVTVRVTGKAPRLLPVPGLGTVTQVAEASKERFTTPGDAP
ncbi:TadE/TadG family type IV pilus assembly protein [Saccharopolyspora sp. ID03-671]|uniref:TadE/TadG family type IV pilus assembly protein n=1 Tax=Saccharopolyspora sp. ID03-671 TaxID=3073066 RepID=UPI00324F9DE7